MAALVSVPVGGGMSLSLYQLRFSSHVFVASSLLYTVSCLHLLLLAYYASYESKGSQNSEMVVTKFSGELRQCSIY